MFCHSNNSENSGEFQVIAYVQGKIDTYKLEFFYDTWNCLEVTKTWDFTFTYETMLGSENSILKMITQNFSKPTKAFNLENIVQACLVSFQTHRVNKDFSNSIKD